MMMPQPILVIVGMRTDEHSLSSHVGIGSESSVGEDECGETVSGLEARETRVWRFYQRRIKQNCQ